MIVRGQWWRKSGGHIRGITPSPRTIYRTPSTPSCTGRGGCEPSERRQTGLPCPPSDAPDPAQQGSTMMSRMDGGWMNGWKEERIKMEGEMNEWRPWMMGFGNWHLGKGILKNLFCAVSLNRVTSQPPGTLASGQEWRLLPLMVHVHFLRDKKKYNGRKWKEFLARSQETWSWD